MNKVLFNLFKIPQRLIFIDANQILSNRFCFIDSGECCSIDFMQKQKNLNKLTINDKFLLCFITAKILNFKKMVKISVFQIVLVLILCGNFKDAQSRAREDKEEFSYSFINLCASKSIVQNKTFNSYYKFDFQTPLIGVLDCQLFDIIVKNSTEIKKFKAEIFDFVNDGLKNRSEFLLDSINKMDKNLELNKIENRDLKSWTDHCTKYLKPSINGLMKIREGYLPEELMESGRLINFLDTLEPLEKELESVFRNDFFTIFYSKPFVYSLELKYKDFELEREKCKMEILKFSLFMPMVNATHKTNDVNCKPLELPNYILERLEIKNLTEDFANDLKEPNGNDNLKCLDEKFDYEKFQKIDSKDFDTTEQNFSATLNNGSFEQSNNSFYELNFVKKLITLNPIGLNCSTRKKKTDYKFTSRLINITELEQNKIIFDKELNKLKNLTFLESFINNSDKDEYSSQIRRVNELLSKYFEDPYRKINEELFYSYPGPSKTRVQQEIQKLSELFPQKYDEILKENKKIGGRSIENILINGPGGGNTYKEIGIFYRIQNLHRNLIELSKKEFWDMEFNLQPRDFAYLHYFLNKLSFIKNGQLTSTFLPQHHLQSIIKTLNYSSHLKSIFGDDQIDVLYKRHEKSIISFRKIQLIRSKFFSSNCFYRANVFFTLYLPLNKN